MFIKLTKCIGDKGYPIWVNSEKIITIGEVSPEFSGGAKTWISLGNGVDDLWIKETIEELRRQFLPTYKINKDGDIEQVDA